MGKAIRSSSKEGRSILRSVVGYAVIALLCLFGWFGVRTQIGNMLADLTSPSREDALDVASVAMAMSPRDPRPLWLSAMALKRSFVPEDMDQSVMHLEDAVGLNPNNYGSWTDLARGYEQTERYEFAEAALKRSIEIAPAYAIPHWQMANFLIRQGRPDEAMVELRRVIEVRSPYRDQAFGLMWDYFGKDPAVLESLADDIPDAKLALSNFYANRSSGRNALRIWASLTAEQKGSNPNLVKLMAFKLNATGFLKESMAVARDIGMITDEQPETINNGGFEQAIGDPYQKLFWWNVFRDDNRIDALPDSQNKIEGSRSMKIVFRNYAKPELYNVAQSVAVSESQSYRLMFKARTSNLRSAGPPYVEVVTLPSRQHIANTEPFPIGSNDWQDVAIDVNVPAGVEAIEIRTVRIRCPEECSINGTLWYDDFRLSRK